MRCSICNGNIIGLGPCGCEDPNKPDLPGYDTPSAPDLARTCQKLLEENRKLREALRFYGVCSHFEQDNCKPPECDKQYEAETVSGEPINWLCGHGDFTFEDGAVARAALKETE